MGECKSLLAPAATRARARAASASARASLWAASSSSHPQWDPRRRRRRQAQLLPSLEARRREGCHRHWDRAIRGNRGSDTIQRPSLLYDSRSACVCHRASVCRRASSCVVCAVCVLWCLSWRGTRLARETSVARGTPRAESFLNAEAWGSCCQLVCRVGAAVVFRLHTFGIYQIACGLRTVASVKVVRSHVVSLPMGPPARWFLHFVIVEPAVAIIYGRRIG